MFNWVLLGDFSFLVLIQKHLGSYHQVVYDIQSITLVPDFTNT